MNNFQVSTDPADIDIAVVHRFLCEESTWARGISLSLVQQSIKHSLNFSLRVDGKQVGFARVVTDHSTFAYLLDVFVLTEHRGRGYSRHLMDAVMSHTSVKSARRVILVSSTARGLYAKYGFTAPAKPETFMEINVVDAYLGK
jgi:predicted GNAT family acetyltransferase